MRLYPSNEGQDIVQEARGMMVLRSQASFIKWQERCLRGEEGRVGAELKPMQAISPLPIVLLKLTP